jgi:hypothetical protein
MSARVVVQPLGYRPAEVDSKAVYIWSADTLKAITVYCRFTPLPAYQLTITANATLDEVYLDGVEVSNTNLPNSADPSKTDKVRAVSAPSVIAVSASRQFLAKSYGILASDSQGRVTDASWKCSSYEEDNWFDPSFDDSNWMSARVVVQPLGYRPAEVDSKAVYIWSADTLKAVTVYCRRTPPK